jgi:hypothetical protein
MSSEPAVGTLIQANEIIYVTSIDGPDETALDRWTRSLELARAARFDGVELPGAVAAQLATGERSVAGSEPLLHGLVCPVMAFPTSVTAGDLLAAELASRMHHSEPAATRLGVRVALLKVNPEASHLSNREARQRARLVLGGHLITALNHFDPRGFAVAVQPSGLLGSVEDAREWLYFHNAAIGLAIDTAEMAEGEEDPFTSVADLGPTLKVVYLTEPLASSRFDTTGLFTALKAINYTGPLAIHTDKVDPAALSQLVTAVRSAWRDAPPSAVAVTEQ